MGIFDIFTKKAASSVSQWENYEFLADGILGENSSSLRKDLKRWFSDEIISVKLKDKVQRREHETAVTDTLKEQTNILRERLKKIDEKLTLRIADAAALESGHPTPTSPRGLDEEAQKELLHDLDIFQASIANMLQFIKDRESRISSRIVWQKWVEAFLEDIEVPLRNLEAIALRLRTFIDRHQ